MISKRGLVAATAAGAGALLFATGPAVACSIGDFSANATAACDTSTGKPMAAITVTDKDPSGTPADISVVLRMASGMSGPVVGTVHIAHPTAAGVTKKILVDWSPGYQWYVQVTAGNLVAQNLDVVPTSPDTACVVPTKPATTPAKPTPTPTRATPVTAAPTTTSPATPSPSGSPTGTVLASTGGSGDNTTIAVLAGAFLLVGAGGLFVLRRRADTGRH